MTQATATVAQPTNEPWNDMESVAVGRAAGTMPVVLFTAACMIMTSRRLPFVFQ